MQKNTIIKENIDKVTPELARVRLAFSGSSTHAVAVAKQGSPLFNKQQGWKILNQVQDNLVLFTTTARGFTLIELLVVVLIIGILAAVALPQYQKAVEKSRATQAITLLKSVAQAYKAHYLATGTNARSFDQLDVDIPFTGNTKWREFMEDTRSNEDWSLQIQIFDNTKVAIFIGRIRGPYSGTGFGYFINEWGLNSPDRLYLPPDTLVCVEQHGFPQEKYCKKIMGSAKQIQSGDVGRVYDLP